MVEKSVRQYFAFASTEKSAKRIEKIAMNRGYDTKIVSKRLSNSQLNEIKRRNAARRLERM